MIIVMNRTVLIPILLSSFLLVGCESELDRCIEANSGDFDESQYKVKRNKNVASLTAIEKEVHYCQIDRLDKRVKELTEQGYSEYNAREIVIYNLANQEILNSCIKDVKTCAKKTCNAQGIY